MAGSVGSMLVPLVALTFIITPPTLAYLINRKARAFHKEAFGQYARMAKHTRFMVWIVFAYHILVLLQAAATGVLLEIFTYPVSDAAMALYGRILVGSIVYALMWGIAHAMQQIIEPSGRGSMQTNTGESLAEE